VERCRLKETLPLSARGHFEQFLSRLRWDDHERVAAAALVARRYSDIEFYL